MSAQRWAAMGAGQISRSVVPGRMACEGADVVVVQSRDEAKAAAFASEFGIPASTDSFDEVLADGSIDAIYLATPFATHFDMTRRAIIAGKHVLVEKPIATTAAEVETLFALAAERRVFLMEAMWMKFNPAFLRLTADIRAGRIGDVRSLRASFSLAFGEEGGSRWDPARSGSTLLDQGIYPVTLAHSVLGEPRNIHASGVVRDDDLDLSEHFTLDFDGGRYAHGACGMTEFSDLAASVSGTAGWITLPAPFWATTSLEIHADTAEKIFREPERLDLPKEGNGYVPMAREVTRAISDGLLQHPAHDATATVAVFRTLDAIRTQVRGSRTPAAARGSQSVAAAV